ncbi:type II toxin-antitoxin system RelE/ParE family toxin [Microcella sp.]|uniref:type II toxin-antitoxin system RelE/ParE family toxin n=1 Tax=Microcella sp. TaxID=1913979 RepID=UPI00255D3272|nr:type II toxin-antitoxin system RelE/ParE family toxin [Microcella sp.]MBX9470654.1 type II toxin-antitoxin system RelE/ParE family toxin [Microcella sp.]
MTATVVLREAAQRDIELALDWYLAVAPEYADRFLSDLDATLRGVADAPRAYRSVYGHVRRAALRRFPYLVWFIYLDDTDSVVVLAVTHQRQDPKVVKTAAL